MHRGSAFGLRDMHVVPGRPPDYAKAYCNLGAAYAQMGRYSKAVLAFEEAVRLNPDDSAAQQNLKMTYEKIKD